MKKVLVAGASVRAEGQGGENMVEDKEKKEEKTHFGLFGKDFEAGLMLGKGIQQKSHAHNRKLSHIMTFVRDG